MRKIADDISTFLMVLVPCCLILAAVTTSQAKSETTMHGSIDVFRIPTKLVRPVKGHRDRDLVVYTPPGYNAPQNAQTRYPVVYLLHGSPGNAFNFLKFGELNVLCDKLIADGLVAPAIIVAPDGNYAGEAHGDSEWVNSPDGKDKFDEFVASEVVGYVDSHLRSLPDPQHRVIGGVSEGGYGAANIALKHPNVFGAVLSMSGYFTNDGSGWARPMMGHDQSWLDANSPLTVISGKANATTAGLRQVRFFLGAGLHEKTYTDQTKQFANALKLIGVDAKLDLITGKHGWLLWTQLLSEGLEDLLPAAGNQ
ncbi:MAG TPA: alpha/beta hydrolase-fold protein [Capsulimonadaceae bacterium]